MRWRRIGIQRTRGRDLATGSCSAPSIGLAALFLYLYAASHSTTGAEGNDPVRLGIRDRDLDLPADRIARHPRSRDHDHRLSTAPARHGHPSMAAARGIPVRAIGILYLIALALAAALAAITIGSILGTALLIGPAASALRLSKRPLVAMLTAAGIGIGAMWLGIVLAYDSFEWANRTRVANQLLRRRPRFHFLSALWAARATPPTPRRRSRAPQSASARARRRPVDRVLRVHGQCLGGREHRRGRRRHRRNLHRPARLRFGAHAIPNGSFAGAAGASLIGVSTLLGSVSSPSPAHSGSECWAAAVARRGDRARACDDARPRCAVPQLQREFTPAFCSTIFRKVLRISVDEVAPTAILGAADPRRRRLSSVL